MNEVQNWKMSSVMMLAVTCCMDYSLNMSMITCIWLIQIFHTHVLNKDTHVDRFWYLISTFTEYHNIFIN